MTWSYPVECPNCNFQNVPGLRACARCQSLLDFSSVSIDPPRAADVALPLSLRHAGTRAGLSLRDSWAAFCRDARSVFHPDVNWGSITRSVIPGWGHCRLGHRRFGWFIFGVWLVLVALTVLLRGGPGGRTSYFLLVGWHGLVFSLIMARPMQHLPLIRRAGIGLLVYALLTFCLYLPARWLLGGTFVPFTATGIAGTAFLRDGDTVIHTGRWTRPEAFRPGDLVVYEIRPVSGPGVYIRAGMGIDRIVAGPGDTVSSDGSGFAVNGVPVGASLGPLRRVPMLEPFGVTLTPEEYFIVPSLFTLQGQRNSGFWEIFLRASVVHKDRITGKVLWRSRPLSRFGAMEALPDPLAQEARP